MPPENSRRATEARPDRTTDAHRDDGLDGKPVRSRCAAALRALLRGRNYTPGRRLQRPKQKADRCRDDENQRQHREHSFPPRSQLRVPQTRTPVERVQPARLLILQPVGKPKFLEIRCAHGNEHDRTPRRRRADSVSGAGTAYLYTAQPWASSSANHRGSASVVTHLTSSFSSRGSVARFAGRLVSGLPRRSI
jgi:hypothetical protein